MIANRKLLERASTAVAHAQVIRLEQGLALLPIVDELLDVITTGADDADQLGFWKLPGGFAEVLAGWSAAGPVAYVEADYFGGTGTQTAAVWEAGVLALGPLHLAHGIPVAADGTPISKALRLLGVTRHGHADEFDTVGLGRHRHTDDWAHEW